MSATAVSNNLLSLQSESSFLKRRVDQQPLSQDLNAGKPAGAPQHDSTQVQNNFRHYASADAGPAVLVKLESSVSSAITSGADRPPVNGGGSTPGIFTSGADGPPVSTGGSTGRIFNSGADTPPVNGGGSTRTIFTSGADAPPVSVGGSAKLTGSFTFASAADAPPLIAGGGSEIVLSLFNSTASSSAQSSGVSVTA
jgi:hypothetical protein